MGTFTTITSLIASAITIEKEVLERIRLSRDTAQPFGTNQRNTSFADTLHDSIRTKRDIVTDLY